MTDNDIIKALEEWIKALKDDYKRLQALGAPMDCFEESHIDNIRVLSNALDLINRQNAEIERLTTTVDDGAEVCHNCHSKYAEKIKQAKAEAVKEFAERLKEIITMSPKNSILIDKWYIDNFVKEMVGEE